MHRIAIATTLTLLLGQTWAMAIPITYVETATATGGLGSNPFTNALITITATADTNNVGPLFTGAIFTNNSSATVNVSGIGTATFTIPTYTFDNPNTGIAGVTTFNPFDILNIRSGAFGTYDLTSAIGPITGGTVINPGDSFGTTSGDFVLNALSSSGTFQAIVPEPTSSAILCAVALASLTRIRKKDELKSTDGLKGMQLFLNFLATDDVVQSSSVWLCPRYLSRGHVPIDASIEEKKMMDAKPPFAKWFAPRLAVTVFALLCAFTVTPTRAALSFVQNFGSAGSGGGQFSFPRGVTVDSAGNVYVADASNNRIVSFNPANFAGTFTSFGSFGSGSGQFNSPQGVTLDSAGNVYVADFMNNRIDRFNPANFAGTFTSFGSADSGSGQFSLPRGITVDSAGNVYVADSDNNRIDRFNPANFAGTFTSFGSFGSGSGQFSNPFGVAVDSAGNVYVADRNNSRIDSFNPANFAGTFISFGSEGRFSDPDGVTVDSAGNVYVAEFGNNRIDGFNPANFAGTFTAFGSFGSGSGQFNGPLGVTLDSAGNVYVADFNNSRIVELTGAAVPEPASALLLAAAGASLLLRQKD